MAVMWGNGRMLVGLLESYEATHDAKVLESARRLGDWLVAMAPLMNSAETLKLFNDGKAAVGYNLLDPECRRPGAAARSHPAGSLPGSRSRYCRSHHVPAGPAQSWTPGQFARASCCCMKRRVTRSSLNKWRPSIARWPIPATCCPKGRFPNSTCRR